MLRVLFLTSMMGFTLLLVAQEPTTNTRNNNNEATATDGEPTRRMLDQYLTTIAELESAVMAERTVTDGTGNIIIKDVVTPIEEFYRTVLTNLSGSLASFTEFDLGVTLELTPEDQVLITEIDPDGRFHLTKLKPNDVIVEINDELEVDQIEDPLATVHYLLYPYARVLKGFDPLVLKVARDGDLLDVEISNDDAAIQIGQFNRSKLKNSPILRYQHGGKSYSVTHTTPLPSVYLLEIEEDLGQYFGVEFGVLVLQAPKDSGFKAGDILEKIENTSIRAIDHVTKALKRAENDEITTTVKRDKKKVEVKMSRSSPVFRNAEEQMFH